jgi:hypothetical protein
MRLVLSLVSRGATAVALVFAQVSEERGEGDQGDDLDGELHHGRHDPENFGLPYFDNKCRQHQRVARGQGISGWWVVVHGPRSPGMGVRATGRRIVGDVVHSRNEGRSVSRHGRPYSCPTS